MGPLAGVKVIELAGVYQRRSIRFGRADREKVTGSCSRASTSTYVEIDGVVQPAPGPRFSRTVLDKLRPPAPSTTENAVAALRDWLSDADIETHPRAGTFA